MVPPRAQEGEGVRFSELLTVFLKHLPHSVVEDSIRMSTPGIGAQLMLVYEVMSYVWAIIALFIKHPKHVSGTGALFGP